MADFVQIDQTGTTTLPHPTLRGLGDLEKDSEQPFATSASGISQTDLPIPLVVFDAEGIIRGANRLLTQLLGYNDSALIGQPVETLYPDADRAAHRSVRQTFLSRASDPMPTMHREVFARRRNGTLIPIELSMMLVPTAVGVMFTASMRDSSRHVEIEKALTEAADEADAANVAKSRSGIEPKAHSQSLKLRLLLPTGQTAYPVDPQRLRQVVLNLLSNAIKFTDTGGTITLALSKDATGMKVQVSDTGTGIAPAVLENIFELYVRSETDRNVTAGGLGIGLHVSKRLTEAMGGNITITSTLGEGTTVTLAFPPSTAIPANER